jgi:erythritol transport system substrate-binding protein
MKKLIAGAASMVLVLMLAMTGCGASVSVSTDDYSDVVSPEEVGGEIPAEDISEEPVATSAESAASAEVSIAPAENASSVSSTASGNSKSTISKSSTVSKAVVIESNASILNNTSNEPAVIFAILPSEAGSSATEAAIIRAGVSGAGYTVTVRTHGNSMENQTAAFNEAIASDAAAIICDNVEGDGTASSIQAAKDAGIPTFLIDRGIEMTGVAEAQILTDRFSSVPVLAQVFAKNRNHKTEYIELAGSSGDSRAADAMNAFNDAISSFSTISRAESAAEDSYSHDSAKAKAAELLRKNPGADVLVCYNEMETKAGLEAIQEAGRSGMQVYCICGDGDEIENLISGGEVAASIVKPAETLASTAAKEAVEYLSTGSFGSNERQYISADILTAGGIAR